MPSAQLLNITIHILTGAIAIVIGIIILFSAKGLKNHRQLGKAFLVFASIVCITALIGTALFRFIPVFATLTLLVSYLCISGWRNIKTQANGPNPWDAAFVGSAVVALSALTPTLYQSANDSRSTTIMLVSSAAALVSILTYDIAKHFFPSQWHAKLWRYEHIYRMLSALFGMLSAAVGNLLQTLFAQLIPSIIGIFMIGYYFWRERKKL